LLCLLVAGLMPLGMPAQRWHADTKGLPQHAPAQPLDDLAHMSWTRRDGAPSDIAALAQTKDGYLWIGSSFGLFRFDGLQFQSYPFTAADPRLPSSDIAALAADRDGGLWIGYRMGGISYLRDGKKVDYDGHSGLVSESTEQLLCRDDGSVWATADGRLMHFTGSGWENFSLRHGLASEGLYSLFFDRDENLWTADKGHVYELKTDAGTFAQVASSAKVVNQFAQLPSGAMWISDAWSSVRPLADGRPADAVRIPGVPILLADRDGSIWLANDFGGLTRIKHPRDATARQVEYYAPSDGLTDGQTRAILQDRQGAIWVGTARGLDRFRPSPVVPFRGVQLNYYPALVADKNGGIWIHDMDKPLMRLRDGQLTFVGKGHGSSSLFEDSDGSVWMLDQITRDFYRYPENGGAPQRIPSPPEGRQVETWCLGKDPQGNLLACFEGHGLWRYAGAWEHVTAPGLPKESPISLMKARDGSVWLGFAHNQIAHEDAKGFAIYGEAQGLALNSVFAFYDGGDLVFAGGSDGLAYFADGQFHSMLLRVPGLLRGISGIVKDRFGDLWLNAASGVIRLPQAEWKKAVADPQYAMDFQLLNEQDGLLGSPTQSKPTPSAVVDTSGLLWFATSGHLVSIDPALARQSVSRPNVLLESVVVNGAVHRYREGETLNVGAGPLKTLEFDYIGVDLSLPDRVTYQYMLEGQDKEWQDAESRRQAFYTNLPAGTYRFHVRAASGTGRWNELTAPMQLTVTAPFYSTVWFYVLCCLAAFGVVWVVYQLRVQHITGRVRQRLEARAQERIRIARDLHDTLLQGVQGLVLRFHFATEQLPAEEPVRATLRAALDQADEVIHEGREKVRELRAETAAPGDLEKNLRRAAETLQADGAAKITMRVKGQPRTLHAAVQEELYSIAREALTNAVRHAHAAEIVLELAYEQKQLRLMCRDGGRGVTPEVMRAGFKRGHFGIPGMRERARGLGCTLDFTSTKDGTRVQVSVNARKAYLETEDDSGWRERLWRWLPQSPRGRSEPDVDLIAEAAPGSAAATSNPAPETGEHVPQAPEAWTH
jgi:signal transduction histidine kinase/ligand-binding sensor domain-containing protein